MTDATHDPTRRSWVASANGHTEFPIQNLPFGVFSTPGDKRRAAASRSATGSSTIGARCEAGLFVRRGARCGRGGGGPDAECAARARRAHGAALRQRAVGILEPPTATRAAMPVAPAARRGRVHDASAGDDRRLHRLLRRHPPRDERRQTVPARQSAAAELQVGADRLSRPRLVDRRQRRRRSAAARPAQAAERRPRRRSGRAAISTTSWNSAF